ncbi:MAG: DUF4956 domain-containing protein [Candidatus Hydrogenedentota bacterium]|nr:MAG: DUF4956 domain-containing protein [Candidatus Hydrogenedentota bacterium]
MSKYLPGNIAITLPDLVLGILLATLAASIAALLYRATHRGLSYEPGFASGLVLVAPIVSVIMMLIGSSLALSLGMVGALSIIRFRTAIKDTRDMIFLFWTIAIGLSAGTYNWKVTIVSTALLASIILVVEALQRTGRPSRDYVLILRGTGAPPLDALSASLREHGRRSNIRSVDTSDDSWEVAVELGLEPASVETLQTLLQALRALPNTETVSAVAPQASLPF